MPSMNAVQRTTTAFTLFKAGTKDNVDPPLASFTINHRIHSAQTCDEVNLFYNIITSNLVICLVFI